MAKRVILGGVLGGIALFLWGSLSHIVLGLGEIGIKELPNETAVLGVLQSSIPEPGFYLFPGAGLSANATREERSAALTEIDGKARTGPNGILVIHPHGGGGFTAGRLINELLLNLLQGLLAAALIAWAGPAKGYLSKVGFVTAVGVFAAIATNVQYWNWYGFPTSYVLAYMVTQIIGFAIAGLVVGAVLKQPIAVLRAASAPA